ncbi:MAG TPA: acyltransferase [Clostridium sp.]|uniref:acyltransferase n=1 Tax=Clostridium sp. TaxID=1506 RepID=UPI002F95B4BC
MKMIIYLCNVLNYVDDFKYFISGGSIINTYLSKKIKIISLISIIMVVYLHSYNLNTSFLNNPNITGFDLNSFVQEFITNGITRIAVPLFFCISGYLFFLNFKPSLNSFLIKYKKRFFSLLVPFLFWSILGVLFYFLIQSIIFPKEIITSNLIRSYSIKKLINTIFIDLIPYQLWFISELLKIVIFSPIIYFYISRFSYFSIAPFLLFWFFDIDILVLRTDGILFFIFGAFLAIKGLELDILKIESKKIRRLFPFIWIVILVLMTYLKLKGVPNDYYLNKISTIIGIFTIWFNYDLIIQNKWIEDKLLYLSSFTFFIFASHEPILSMLKRLILKSVGISSFTNLFVYLIAPVIIITSSVIVATILKKNAYWFYNIITGGRSNKIK